MLWQLHGMHEWQLPGWQFTGWQLLGGSSLGDSCLGAGIHIFNYPGACYVPGYGHLTGKVILTMFRTQHSAWLHEKTPSYLSPGQKFPNIQEWDTNNQPYVTCCRLFRQSLWITVQNKSCHLDIVKPGQLEYQLPVCKNNFYTFHYHLCILHNKDSMLYIIVEK